MIRYVESRDKAAWYTLDHNSMERAAKYAAKAERAVASRKEGKKT